MNVTASVPRHSVNTVAAAELNALWPLTYSGCAGVVSRDVQFTSASVSEFACLPARAMAVAGRQKLWKYLASQQATAVSKRATFKVANNCTVSSSGIPRSAAIVRAMEFQWPRGVSVYEKTAQDRAISVCSLVRLSEIFPPHFSFADGRRARPLPREEPTRTAAQAQRPARCRRVHSIHWRAEDSY